MGYYIYKDKIGQWRWYYKASNGRKIADSGEGYYNREDCLSGVAIMRGSANAPVYDLTK